MVLFVSILPKLVAHDFIIITLNERVGNVVVIKIHVGFAFGF
jgi:DNA-directed RNA polymerase subunit H (RpoH/RPB5)